MNNISPGNATNTNFFQNSLANRVGAIPAASALVGFANRPLGRGTLPRYNSLVAASRQNGAGPAIPPTNAPFSFTQFATGKRTIIAAINKRMGKK